MFPLILSAIQAVVGQKQKKEQEEQQRRLAAAQGVAFQPPKSNALGTAAGLAGNMFGGGGEKKPGAGQAVDDALKSYDAHQGQSNLAGAYDEDLFGGIS